MLNWLKSTNVVRGGQRARIVILLFAFTVCFHWRLVLTDQYTWLNSPDLAYQVLPWWQFQVGEWQQGNFPLWDPFVFGGQPLIGQAQPGAAYPLNWLLFILPTRHGWIKTGSLNCYYVCIHFLAVLFAYKLCRDLRLDRAPSVLGGIVYGMSGYMGAVDWPQMFNGALWGPLILMYLLRAARNEKLWASAAMGGCFLGVSLLSGHHQVPIFFGLASAGLWIWMAVRTGKLDRRVVAAAALFFVIAGMTSGLQSVPGWEYSKNAVRWVGVEDPAGHNTKVPYLIHDRYSLKPFMLLSLLFPGIDAQAVIYAGIVAVLIALLGAMGGWARMEVRVASFLSVGGILYALGSTNAFHGMLYALLPVVDKARSPTMATVVFDLGLTILAAFGLQYLLEWPRSPVVKTIQRLALAFAGFIFVLAYTYQLFRAGVWTGAMIGIVTGLAALLFAGFLGAWRSGELGWNGAAICAIALVVVELGNGRVSYAQNVQEGWAHLKLLRTSSEMVERIRALGPLARIELRSEDVAYNIGDWIGVDVWHGYLASATRDLYRVGMYDERIRQLFGVKYYVGPEPRQGWNEEIYRSPNGWHLYRNAGAFPRSWVIHNADKVADWEAAAKWMQAGDRDWHKTTVLFGNTPKIERCEGEESASVVRRTSNHVRILANLNCRGLVMLGDTFYPGWTATVDGVPVEIYEAYASIRAVSAGPGNHTIEMRYRPWTVYLGAFLTGFGFVCTILIRQLDLRRKL